MAKFVAPVTRGAEGVLAEELSALGIQDVREERGAVVFQGGMAAGYRACMWSRTASRVLLRLEQFECGDADDLYDGLRTIRWTDHLGPDSTLMVDFVGVSSSIRNSKFGALRTKDAIVDSVRDATGARPNVDLTSPDVRVNVHLSDDRAAVSIDLSGAALHIRGTRVESGPANLKENLAAALLMLARWPERAARGEPLYDPMCGSGTLLTEAAGMALGRAPGLRRTRWGFQRWRGHDSEVWDRIVAEAGEREPAEIPSVRGADIDGRMVAYAEANIRAAKLPIQVEKRALADTPAAAEDAGVFITNPPYGERMERYGDVGPLYGEIGNVLRRRFLGWTGFVLTTPKLGKRIGLKPARRHIIHNGPIECRLFEIPISGAPVARDT